MAASNVVGRVNRILAGHGMAGQGKWFVYYAARHNVDLGLLVGIAGAETTWGDAGTGTPGSGYNPFGFMRSGPGTGLRFGSYKEAISRAASLLATSRYRKNTQPGRANPGAFMRTYVGYSSGDWLETTSRYANTLGKGKGGKVPKGGGGKMSSEWVYPLAKKGKYGGGSAAHHARALGNWQSDNAVDIYIPIGTPVIAIHSGKIGRVDKRALDGGQFSGGSLYLSGGGHEFWYKHLKKVLVKEGQYVKAGQIVGYSGEGNGVPHLHLAWSQSGDPYDFVSKFPTAKNARLGAGPTAPGMPPSPGRPARPAAPVYQPHYGVELEQSGLLRYPGQALEVGPEPASIANMWQSLASLPNSSPETSTFANRAFAWGGG